MYAARTVGVPTAIAKPASRFVTTGKSSGCKGIAPSVSAVRLATSDTFSATTVDAAAAPIGRANQALKSSSNTTHAMPLNMSASSWQR